LNKILKYNGETSALNDADSNNNNTVHNKNKDTTGV